ncbi:hypothetical protein QQF64_011278 [Cirrhinus molitorella]|uniref:Tc1-like transposase DDE domain-containing protein n=1 Tax=Cirrhinus molitorella TaxID=172907 RepID=A0ABR3LYR9_9TELE
MDGGGLRQMRVRVKGRGVRGRGVHVREAGQRVQPVLNKNTVASIVRSFQQENRGKIFSAEQEAAVVNMVVANNAIRLREIREAVVADQGIFRNINNVRLTTIDRILRRNHMAMKQLYRVPFQRKSDVVKGARCQYVEQSEEMWKEPHWVQGTYNPECLITFLNALHERLIPPEERGLLRPGMPLFVIIQDNVAFHHSRLVNECISSYCFQVTGSSRVACFTEQEPY